MVNQEISADEHGIIISSYDDLVLLDPCSGFDAVLVAERSSRHEKDILERRDERYPMNGRIEFNPPDASLIIEYHVANARLCGSIDSACLSRCRTCTDPIATRSMPTLSLLTTGIA